jgi:hypothetical protein
MIAQPESAMLRPYDSPCIYPPRYFSQASLCGRLVYAKSGERLAQAGIRVGFRFDRCIITTHRRRSVRSSMARSHRAARPAHRADEVIE